MPGGYAGKILRVNLSNGTITTEEPDDAFYRTYIGGFGFVAYYLLKEVPQGIDPLSPENKLVFALGPATGTLLPGAGRNCVGARSPLTGTFGKSEVGGYWGAELKRAGFDAIIVEGRSPKPVYIWIKDGQVEIRDAAHLWGLPTKEAQDAIRHELRDRLIRTALIGPAGENMVRYAAVINDVASHSAGRGGLGAVLGSKNLKGIATRGRKAPTVADPAGVNELVRWMANQANMESRHGDTHRYGTGGSAMKMWNDLGNIPTRNFEDGYYEEIEKIAADTFAQVYRVGMESCYACNIRCKKVAENKEGQFTFSREYGGPEYETLGAFGSTCGIGDLAAVCLASELCSAYGLDTISCGVTIAFAMECFEKGILTLADTGGLDLHFGNAESMVKLIEMITKREGIGDLLAEGSRLAAQRIGKGADQYAMQVKGLEIPMHEPRLKHGLGIGYAVSAIGADHCQAMHDTSFDRETWDIDDLRGLGHSGPLPLTDLGPAKVAMARDVHFLRTFADCLVSCTIVRWSPAQLEQLVRAVTGWSFTIAELLKACRRFDSMARAFNVRDGFTAADDTLPERFFQPTKRGWLKETAIDREQFRRAIQNYYLIMGWTPEGVPTRETMVELGVPWVADAFALPSAIEAQVPVPRSGA